MKKTYRIAVVPGDGIGPEVTAEGVKILDKISELNSEIGFECVYFPWGCKYYLEHGRMMDADGLERLAAFDAIYLGAVGDPDVPDHVSLWELLLVIRKSFDQYINLRPVVLLKGAPCPFKNVAREDVDMIFVRENVEGEYSGAGEWITVGGAVEGARQTGVFTRTGVERVIRYAFELARRERKTLTSVSKGNALNYSMVFWDSVFNEISEEYSDVRTSSYLVDAACMFMVREPRRFQVVVTSNLFGDIMTDLGAAIAGGMGLAAGANLNPERRFPSMFEPIHGAAPDIAGRGVANPMAAIWSVSQMLDHFGLYALGREVLASVEDMLTDGVVLTPDVGGSSSTAEVGDAVAARLAARLGWR